MLANDQSLPIEKFNRSRNFRLLFRTKERERLLIAKTKARFKRRILHAPNRIAKLNACKMRRLNQLNATYFNSMRVSRIFY